MQQDDIRLKTEYILFSSIVMVLKNVGDPWPMHLTLQKGAIYIDLIVDLPIGIGVYDTAWSVKDIPVWAKRLMLGVL